MAVGRGPTSLREYRRTRSSTRCGRIRCGAGCSTRGPSGAFTYRSTRAITGSASLSSSSSPSPERPEQPDTALNIPLMWIRPPQTLSTARGMHRFVWDLHGEPPPAMRHEYPISAIPGDTPREPRGPWVLPGRYAVRLAVYGVVEGSDATPTAAVRAALGDLERALAELLARLRELERRFYNRGP